jgi:hypothetical protein
MDATRFDRWTRALSAMPSRRQTFAVLLGGVALLRETDDSSAGSGCKNVGAKCKKKKDCCSGVCKGKKGKKKCKAHDTGGCQAGQRSMGCGGGENVPCTTSAGEDGLCQATTGNGGYCSGSGLICTPCSKDAECRSFCGPDAACIQCAESCVTSGTACVGPVECS